MRWVFLSLVVINLLAFAVFWKQQAEQQQQQADEPLPVLEGKNIKLLSELDPSALLAKQITQGKSVKDVQRCYSVGPFATDIDAKHMKARARALGFEPNLRQLTASQQNEYWVYIPPLASRQKALQMLKELQTRKIDSYVITTGDLADGVSLGLFRNQELAEELNVDMHKLGYGSEIKPVSRGKKEMWMEFREVSQLTEVMRHKISADNGTVRWELVECLLDETETKTNDLQNK